MTKTLRILKPELVSLVHNIELNNSDWWEKTIQKLIIAILWLENKELNIADITKKLSDELPITTNQNQINLQIQILCDKNILLPIKDKYKISEKHKQEFENDLHKTEQITEKAKGKFFIILAKECPSLDPEEAWATVNRELFLPSVQQMGAKFYELLSGSKSNIDENFNTESFLKKYDKLHQAGLKSSITEYLSSGDKDIHDYILRYINAAFVLEASSLQEKTIDLLKKSATNKVAFTIFVDTNFVFSLLGVHNNPFNDDASLLSNLVREVSSKIATRFYIAPITAEETKSAIENAVEHYDNLKFSPNLAKASLRTKHIGGFLRKLVKEVSNSNQTISGKEFFEVYKNDLLTILRAKGIELFNEKLDKYTFDQNVIDDINFQMKFEAERFKEDAKTYEKIKHDITLWHFIKDKRPLTVESPADANFWIVTVDFRFLGFDAFKRKNLGNSQPICVLPSQLIHILQFWIPRTSNLEEMLFDSWMWPVIFQDFDPDAEKSSIRILETLNRFENFQDLPEEAVSQILLDSALRRRILAEKDTGNQIELIKDALIQQLKESDEKNSKAAESLKKADLDLKNASETEKQLAYSLRAKDAEIDALAAELNRLSYNIDLLQTNAVTKEKTEERRKFTTQTVIYFTLSIFSCFYIGYTISNMIGLNFIAPTIGLLFFTAFIFILIVDKKATTSQTLSDWKPIQKLKLFKNWVLLLLGLAGTTLFGKVIEMFVWDPIKNFLEK